MQHSEKIRSRWAVSFPRISGLSVAVANAHIRRSPSIASHAHSQHLFLSLMSTFNTAWLRISCKNLCSSLFNRNDRMMLWRVYIDRKRNDSSVRYLIHTPRVMHIVIMSSRHFPPQALTTHVLPSTGLFFFTRCQTSPTWTHTYKCFQAG